MAPNRNWPQGRPQNMMDRERLHRQRLQDERRDFFDSRYGEAPYAVQDHLRSMEGRPNTYDSYGIRQGSGTRDYGYARQGRKQYTGFSSQVGHQVVNRGATRYARQFENEPKPRWPEFGPRPGFYEGSYMEERHQPFGYRDAELDRMRFLNDYDRDGLGWEGEDMEDRPYGYFTNERNTGHSHVPGRWVPGHDRSHRGTGRHRHGRI